MCEITAVISEIFWPVSHCNPAAIIKYNIKGVIFQLLTAIFHSLFSKRQYKCILKWIEIILSSGIYLLFLVELNQNKAKRNILFSAWGNSKPWISELLTQSNLNFLGSSFFDTFLQLQAKLFHFLLNLYILILNFIF